jgi:hypothetical protein
MLAGRTPWSKLRLGRSSSKGAVPKRKQTATRSTNCSVPLLLPNVQMATYEGCVCVVWVQPLLSPRDHAPKFWGSSGPRGCTPFSFAKSKARKTQTKFSGRKQKDTRDSSVISVFPIKNQRVVPELCSCYLGAATKVDRRDTKQGAEKPELAPDFFMPKFLIFNRDQRFSAPCLVAMPRSSLREGEPRVKQKMHMQLMLPLPLSRPHPNIFRKAHPEQSEHRFGDLCSLY